jgi:spore coat polysaccharide biosynthesis protein SpsF
MNIVCIVQARMGSERLPGKVMKPILNHPMIEYTLNRLAQSKYIDEVILATSDKSEDVDMGNYLTDKGFKVFCGNEKNVLKRYVDANAAYKGDVVIRVTGDCPLIDSVIVDNVITCFLANVYDYVRLDVPNTFIRGFDVEVFSIQALERVYKIVENEPEDSPYKEHVTFYMYKHPNEFNIGAVKGSEIYNKAYRLCVDTKEDFELVKNIYEYFGDMYISAKEIINYLDNNKNIAMLNLAIKQKIYGEQNGSM